MACGPKCWNSVNDKCKCSCGGKNHGKGDKGEEMVATEKSFPPCTPVRFKWYYHGRKDIWSEKTGRSLGQTFLLKGKVRLGAACNGIDYWCAPDDLKKEHE